MGVFLDKLDYRSVFPTRQQVSRLAVSKRSLIYLFVPVKTDDQLPASKHVDVVPVSAIWTESGKIITSDRACHKPRTTCRGVKRHKKSGRVYEMSSDSIVLASSAMREK